MTAAVKCAPQDNKPNPFEISNCSQHLFAEVQMLEQTTNVILTLGKVAFDAYCKLFKIERLTFAHGACYRIDHQKTLLVSYYPSRRNTSTGHGKFGLMSLKEQGH